MKIIKNDDHYLFQNQNGEYHMSLDQFNSLGEEKAKEYAIQEIDLKNKSSYKDPDIDFQRARNLGFCEYGIEDFSKMLNLNINKTYKISFLKEKLSLSAFLEYPNECIKLFGNSILDKFGGPKLFLQNNKTQEALNIILNNNIIEDKKLHELAIIFALKNISNFEKEFPNDDRPRKAIEAKMSYLNGEVTLEELSAAKLAARSAAMSAERLEALSMSAAGLEARSAAMSASESAAKSALWAAEYSAWSALWAAEYSAWSAADSVEPALWCSAWSTEVLWQIEEVLKIL